MTKIEDFSWILSKASNRDTAIVICSALVNGRHFATEVKLSGQLFDDPEFKPKIDDYLYGLSRDSADALLRAA
jgi:hypothetical protein